MGVDKSTYLLVAGVILLVFLSPVLVAYFALLPAYLLGGGRDAISFLLEYFEPRLWIMISGSATVIVAFFIVGLFKVRNSHGFYFLTGFVLTLTLVLVLYMFTRIGFSIAFEENIGSSLKTIATIVLSSISITEELTIIFRAESLYQRISGGAGIHSI